MMNLPPTENTKTEETKNKIFSRLVWIIIIIIIIISAAIVLSCTSCVTTYNTTSNTELPAPETTGSSEQNLPPSPPPLHQKDSRNRVYDDDTDTKYTTIYWHSDSIAEETITIRIDPGEMSRKFTSSDRFAVQRNAEVAILIHYKDGSTEEQLMPDLEEFTAPRGTDSIQFFKATKAIIRYMDGSQETILVPSIRGYEQTAGATSVAFKMPDSSFKIRIYSK